jgi:hypothetical protein
MTTGDIARHRDRQNLPITRNFNGRGALERINCLQRDIWTNASFDGRLHALREAEINIAASQGRVPSRVYAVSLDDFVEGQAGRIQTDRVVAGSPYAWRDLAEGKYIQVKSGLLILQR